MGYKAKKYHLTFDESTGHEGLEATMRSLSTANLLKIQKLGAGFSSAKLDGEAFEELVEILSSSMIEWNVEDDDDAPVPTTVEGILSQDPDLIMTIITVWTTAAGGIKPPLDGGSTSGPAFPEASLQMETLSPSLSS